MAARKVNKWVRRFGMVFTFAGANGEILISVVCGTVGQTWARAARDLFKDFGVLGPQNPKIFSTLNNWAQR